MSTNDDETLLSWNQRHHRKDSTSFNESYNSITKSSLNTTAEESRRLVMARKSISSANETLWETQILAHSASAEFIFPSLGQHRKIIFVRLIKLIKTWMKGITILISTNLRSCCSQCERNLKSIINSLKFEGAVDVASVGCLKAKNYPKTTQATPAITWYILSLLRRERANIDCANKIDTAYQLQISSANVYC